MYDSELKKAVLNSNKKLKFINAAGTHAVDLSELKATKPHENFAEARSKYGIRKNTFKNAYLHKEEHEYYIVTDKQLVEPTDAETEAIKKAESEAAEADQQAAENHRRDEDTE